MKKSFLLFSFLTFLFLGVNSAQAVCPVCAVVVSSGVGLSRWLGVDDSITGLWIGGVTLSVVIWTLDYMRRKNINFKYKKFLTAFSYYALVFVSMYSANLISNPIHTICSCVDDRLFVSMVIGSFGLWCGSNWYDLLKEKNGGHAHFPFEKVVMPVIPLAVMSFVFYLLTK